MTPQVLDDLLLYRFSRLAGTAGTMVVRLCEGRFGITRREWRMVALLAEDGPLQPSQLARRAQLDRARTSRAISSLVAKGLMRRSAQHGDQRYAQVALTDEGRRLHESLFPLIADINRRLLAPLDACQVDALADMLVRIQRQSDASLAESRLPKANRGRGRRVVDPLP